MTDIKELFTTLWISQPPIVALVAVSYRTFLELSELVTNQPPPFYIKQEHMFYIKQEHITAMCQWSIATSEPFQCKNRMADIICWVGAWDQLHCCDVSRICLDFGGSQSAFYFLLQLHHHIDLQLPLNETVWALGLILKPMQSSQTITNIDCDISPL